MFDLWNKEPKNHIAFMNVDGNQIVCYLRIFSVFEGVIEISNNAEKYAFFEGRFISNDPVTGALRESSYIDEIIRLNQVE